MKNKRMRNVSRFMALLLSLAMVMAMSVSVFADSITKKDALKIALKNADLSKSKVKQVDVEFEKKLNAYEVEFIKKSNNADYEYKIDAGSGKILEKSIDYAYKHNKSKKKIGKTAAIKKVAKFTGIKVSVIEKGSCKFEREKGEGIYKIKFKYNGRKYECEVLAPTGKIIEYEWKVISK